MHMMGVIATRIISQFLKLAQQHFLSICGCFFFLDEILNHILWLYVSDISACFLHNLLLAEDDFFTHGNLLIQLNVLITWISHGHL